MSQLTDSTYQRYKKYTDKIAEYLLQTAENCGYKTLDPPGAKLKPHTGGRLKGKDRKGAKEKGLNNSGSDNATQTHVYKIRLSQFSELANFIASSNKCRTISDSFIRLLRATTRLRKGRAATYAAESRKKSTIKAANLSHEHFIEVLESVLTILEPKCADATGRSRQPTSQDTQMPSVPFGGTVCGLTNRFEALELEEPLDLDDISAPKLVPHRGLPAMLT